MQRGHWPPARTRPGRLAGRPVTVTGAGPFGLRLGAAVDKGGSTLRKWELRMRACSIASYRLWLQKQYDMVNDPMYEPGFKVYSRPYLWLKWGI